MCNDCGNTTNKMQTQLTFIMLLFLFCNGLCSEKFKYDRLIPSSREHFRYSIIHLPVQKPHVKPTSKDIDHGKRAIEEEVLRSLLTSKVKQSKHIAPLWQLPLQDLCRMLGSLGDALHEAWGIKEKDETEPDYDQSVSGTFAQMLVELHDLQNLCGVLQPRELQDGQEYQDLDHNSDTPPKRKSPYILKRQLRTNKSRRPYILKRSAYY